MRNNILISLKKSYEIENFIEKFSRGIKSSTLLYVCDCFSKVSYTHWVFLKSVVLQNEV